MLRLVRPSEDEPRALQPSALGAALAARPYAWIDLERPTDEEVELVASALGWYPLLAEDVLHRGQRLKAEQFGEALLIAVEEPRPLGEPCELHIVVGPGWLVTAHDGAWTLERARREWAQRADLDRNGPMAAVATLLGAIVDAHAEAVDALEDEVEHHERAVTDAADGETLELLRAATVARQRIGLLRRRVGQLREVVGAIVRRELVETRRSEELDLELRDVYDHVLRTHDDLDVLHERMTALADLRLALVAYRQNEITKRLSAWAAILLVPTIVTGWFGQNFEGLTGLAERHGELYAGGLILATCGVLVILFRRAGWL